MDQSFASDGYSTLEDAYYYLLSFEPKYQEL